MKNFTINSPESRKYLKYITLLLLLLNALTAFIGGVPMIVDPDGNASGLSLHDLEHSPFMDYLIPGIMLVTVHGVLGVFVFIGLILNVRHHAWLVMGQGIILLSWIVIQIIMLRDVNFLHVTFATIGIALIFLGKYLGRFEFA